MPNKIIVNGKTYSLDEWVTQVRYAKEHDNMKLVTGLKEHNMSIDRPKFYQGLRDKKLFTTLAQAQVDSIDAILNECEAQGLTDIRQVAYCLSTAYHEAYNPKHPETRMTPMREMGGEEYLKSKKYYPYVGYGFSQLTWKANYVKESNRLGVDLVAHPEKMLDIPLAANSHVYCLKNGSYTGKKLSDYINDTKCDFMNARRIVNGTDQAEKIMGYTQKFLSCLG